MQNVYLQPQFNVNLKKFLVLGAFIAAFTSVAGQALVVNAGANATVCPGLTQTIGGSPTASGGTPPYSYTWTPSGSLNNATIANPAATPSVPTMYYVTVTDSGGVNTGIDSVFVDLNPIYAYSAGPDMYVCIGDTITIGDPDNSFAGGVTYSWNPGTDLSSTTAPQPSFTGTVTMAYALTITSPVCNSKVDSVTVYVNPLPIVDATGGTTIEEGQSTPLVVTGATTYYWFPPDGLSNTTGALSNAEPTATTTYTIVGVDDNGCQNWDTVTVFVIPNDEIVLYNTFSPNNDGINDYFYIGNIAKYPDCRLEVFTRTGQLVYAKTGYDNSWDGTNYGDRLPETTYYYTLDLGNDSPVLYGHVTIVR